MSDERYKLYAGGLFDAGRRRAILMPLSDNIDESAMQEGFGKRLCLLLNAAHGLTIDEACRRLNVNGTDRS